MNAPESNSNHDSDLAQRLALVFAMVFPTIVTLVYFQWLKDSDSSAQQVAYGIGKTLQFGFPIAWVWLRHREKLKLNPDRHLANDIWIGIGFGVLVVASMILIYGAAIAPTDEGSELTAKVKEKVAGLGIDLAWKFAALGCFYALGHAFLEEYYWRWFVFDLLSRSVSTTVANVLSSLGFMAHHVVLLAFFFGWSSVWTYLVSFSIAIGGFVWAWQYQKTKTLLVPWLSHLIVDAGIFALGYFLVREIFV